MNDSGSRLLLLSAVYIRMYFGRSRVFAAWVSGQARKSRQIRWLVQSVALGPRAKRGQLDATVDTRLIHLHDGVQVDLEVHGWEDGERIVNPVVLVIARDTMHAARTVVLIESNRRSRAVARTIYPR